MKTSPVFALIISILLLGLAQPSKATSLPTGVRIGKPFSVMTRNLYVGADLFQILEAQKPEQVPLMVARTFHHIVENSFSSRVEGFVAEVKANNPDIIGLQEVSLIRMQSPGDFLAGNPRQATIIIYDYLYQLLTALASQGLHYQVAGQVQNADIELPMFAGGDSNGPRFDDIRLTDRDVLLVRKGTDVSHVSARNFQTNLDLSIGGTPVEFTRGYVSAQVDIRGQTYQVVNAHLEVGEKQPFMGVQAAQMQELIAVYSQQKIPTILLGDFNSGPNDPKTQPYHQANDAGFVDMWERSNPFSQGYTCCQDPNLDNKKSLLSRRIDHIFVRNTLNGILPFSIIGKSSTRLVGEKPSHLINKPWPSDHAGVVSFLRLPFIYQ